jgi:membrane fusion protein, multidrug efflux system
MSSHQRHSSALRIALAAVLFLCVSGCKEQPETAAVIRPVKTVVAAQSSGQRLTTYSGVIRARIETALSFRVTGKIIERLVNTGDHVAKDQVIARLDAIDLKLSEQSARANVSAAKTRLSVAQESLDRATTLYPKGFIAKAAVDQRQLETDAAKSALDAAESQASQAGNATNYAELKSDKEGVVTAVAAEPGQVVGAGTPIVRLSEAGEIEAAIAIPEHDVARLTVGQPVSVGLWSAPEVKAQGRIREISGAADPASRTYAVRITIDAPPPSMRLGMTAAVSIAYAETQPSVIAPLAALTGKDNDMAVFVVDRAAGTVSRRPVVIGGLDSDFARIASGLQAGEIIVSAGVQFLSDGQKVRVSGDRPTTATIER